MTNSHTEATALKSRRRVLATIGATGMAGLVAGCLADDEEVDEADDGVTDDDSDDGDGDDEDPPAEAVFELADFSPSAVTVTTTSLSDGTAIHTRPDPSGRTIPNGGTVDFRVTVENTGDATGAPEVKLNIDGETLDSIVFPLPYGESETLTFEAVGPIEVHPGSSRSITVSTEHDEIEGSLEGEERTRPAELGLEPVLTDAFDERPVGITSAPGEDKLYIVQRELGILVYEDGQLLDEPFLDLSDDIVTNVREDGVMDIEFHPNFEENRRCFVTRTAPIREGTPDDWDNTGVIAEFEVSEDGRTAYRDSERTVIEIPSNDLWHNMTQTFFRESEPYLYVTVGDGGGSNGSGNHAVDNWYDGVGGGDAQSTSANLLGAVSRLDIDAEPTEHPRTDPEAPDSPDGDDGYAIPEDNPLVAMDGHYSELYAWGFRSPWGVDIDGDDIYVADVGQSAWEWVNYLKKGNNYGWEVKQGSHCCVQCGASSWDDCPDTTPSNVRGGEPMIDPIIEYPHNGNPEHDGYGICIIGGCIHRGSNVPGLEGQYIFADLIHGERLFVANPETDNPADGWEWDIIPFAEDDNDLIAKPLMIDRDLDGETIILAREGNDEFGIYRLVDVE